ncbi:hypothetical protein H310_11239 [Aphanomyces invadans]|uniref:Uncharacterized protein n=1 Tax=Aphanomyces invadans TaxID=157072 RepID=A0A024TMX9_9STRA|nr:hypothetical protein H310_11239 [Aphanomyces invadans]ETV95349.1 hypothetical protein H310_11239 [Aphanomyces invadans]|eukprot:XP_008876050.1 hypothetical protein H310_11239 [Aphanomyces invadans]
MTVGPARALLWGGLTVVYHHPRAVVDATVQLIMDSPLVLPVYAAAIMNDSQAEIATRAALTALALTVALARTSASPRHWLVITGLLVVVNTFAVYAISADLSLPNLMWSPAVQQAAMNVLATGSYSLLLAVGFFAPTPEYHHAHRQRKYRDQLIAFYAANNPSKLDAVDDLLRRFRLHEEVLFTRLKRKYLDGNTSETVDSEESSDEDDDVSDRVSKRAPHVGAAIQHEEGTNDNDAEEESGTFERADIAPKVQDAIEEVRAAQNARVEARIRRMKK